MTGFSARKLGEGDIPALLALERQCFPSSWSEGQYAAALADPCFHAYGAFSDHGDMAGYLALSLAAGELEVQNIAVLPQLRGRGAATKLLRFALADLSWERAFLEVRPSNAPAVALYAGAGFLASGRRKRYYSDGEDALVMTLDASPTPKDDA